MRYRLAAAAIAESRGPAAASPNHRGTASASAVGPGPRRVLPNPVGRYGADHRDERTHPPGARGAAGSSQTHGSDLAGHVAEGEEVVRPAGYPKQDRRHRNTGRCEGVDRSRDPIRLGCGSALDHCFPDSNLTATPGDPHRVGRVFAIRSSIRRATISTSPLAIPS